jgi:OOP family OmpA-OmpF porin
MRYLTILFCLSCAVSNPQREDTLPDSEAPSTYPSLSNQGAALSPVAPEKSGEAKCPEGLIFNFCLAQRYRVDGIFFQTNSADLLIPESTASLGALLRSLLAQRDMKLVLEVHTDSQGADSYNLVMSQKRADALVAYMVKVGVPEGQLEAKGMGETRPLNAGLTPEDRKLNRRIEISLKPKT